MLAPCLFKKEENFKANNIFVLFEESKFSEMFTFLKMILCSDCKHNQKKNHLF